MKTNEKITVLKDETIGGVEREYREVKRPAKVGERIKVTVEETFGERHVGEIYTVTAGSYGDLVDTNGKWDDGSTLNLLTDEYVVLEPADIVRVSGGTGAPARHRLVERKAAEGERVIIVKAKMTYGMYKNGDVFIAEGRSPAGGVYVKSVSADGNRSGYISDEEYAVLEPVSTPQTAADGLAASDAPLLVLQRQIDTLRKEVDGLTGAVAKLTAATLCGKKADIAVIDEYWTPTRDEIVARAKADVMDLSAGIVEQAYPSENCTVKFIVNRDKRTVVALICGMFGNVMRRGIAKAAPGDCFNVHIGKAIALRRALALDVPEEYVNAPQPTEPRVGDIVKSVGYRAGASGQVTEIGTGSTGGASLLFRCPARSTRSDGNIWLYADDVAIIDDSREGLDEDRTVQTPLTHSPRPTFKPGDRVRIIGNGDGITKLRHYIAIGSTATVVDCDANVCTVGSVIGRSESYRQSVEVEHLEAA